MSGKVLSTFLPGSMFNWVGGRMVKWIWVWFDLRVECDQIVPHLTHMDITIGSGESPLRPLLLGQPFLRRTQCIKLLLLRGMGEVIGTQPYSFYFSFGRDWFLDSNLWLVAFGGGYLPLPTLFYFKKKCHIIHCRRTKCKIIAHLMVILMDVMYELRGHAKWMQCQAYIISINFV